MATANPTPPDRGKANFLLELRRVREQIKHKFFELIESVKARECKLLKELDTILASYHSYRDEFEKQKNSKKTLEQSKEFLEEQLQKSPVKGFHENVIKQTENEIKSIKFPEEPKMVHFVCENNLMLAELNDFGKLVEKGTNINYKVENVGNFVDYKSKVHPVMSFCKKGNGVEQLNYPRGVTIDIKTDNIYVADNNNHCVKVFDSSGKILFKFGDSDGEGKMLHPTGLVISGDRILISNIELGNCFILNYLLNGNFISKIGEYGKGEIEFNFLRGLACDDSNGDIYICDCDNNRIQILSREFRFKSQFGDDKLKHPRGVKLSKEYIFILDESNPCIHLYDYNLILQKSVISRGKGMKVVNPWYFFIDIFNNVLISDADSNSIHIFNPEFGVFHKIKTSTQPMGVVLDNQGRVIVVNQSAKDCLQIF